MVSTLPQKNRGRIILALLSPQPPAVISKLSAHLKKEFGVPVETVDLGHDVAFAFRKNRQQYSSPKVLDKLRKIPKRPDDIILAVVDVDLFCPDYDFVFGEAEPGAGIATLSTFRLKEDAPDAAVYTSRVVKEATHEIGHLYNFGHCEDPGCVMSFSTGNLPQIDAKAASVCRECHASVEAPAGKQIPN